MVDIIKEIKKLMAENKLIVGADEVMKGLRKGSISKVYIAANCPAELKEGLAHYTSIGSVEMVETGIQNDELGDICKKPFSISVMGLVK